MHCPFLKQTSQWALAGAQGLLVGTEWSSLVTTGKSFSQCQWHLLSPIFNKLFLAIYFIVPPHIEFTLEWLILGQKRLPARKPGRACLHTVSFQEYSQVPPCPDGLSSSVKSSFPKFFLLQNQIRTTIVQKLYFNYFHILPWYWCIVIATLHNFLTKYVDSSLCFSQTLNWNKTASHSIQ